MERSAESCALACAACGIPDALFSCGACGAKHYCSDACADVHWQRGVHFMSCAAPPSLADLAGTYLLRNPHLALEAIRNGTLPTDLVGPTVDAMARIEWEQTGAANFAMDVAALNNDAIDPTTWYTAAAAIAQFQQGQAALVRGVIGDKMGPTATPEQIDRAVATETWASVGRGLAQVLATDEYAGDDPDDHEYTIDDRSRLMRAVAVLAAAEMDGPMAAFAVAAELPITMAQLDRTAQFVRRGIMWAEDGIHHTSVHTQVILEDHDAMHVRILLMAATMYDVARAARNPSRDGDGTLDMTALRLARPETNSMYEGSSGSGASGPSESLRHRDFVADWTNRRSERNNVAFEVGGVHNPSGQWLDAAWTEMDAAMAERAARIEVERQQLLGPSTKRRHDGDSSDVPEPKRACAACGRPTIGADTVCASVACAGRRR